MACRMRVASFMSAQDKGSCRRSQAFSAPPAVTEQASKANGREKQRCRFSNRRDKHQLADLRSPDAAHRRAGQGNLNRRPKRVRIVRINARGAVVAPPVLAREMKIIQ